MSAQEFPGLTPYKPLIRPGPRLPPLVSLSRQGLVLAHFPFSSTLVSRPLPDV